MDQKKMGVFLKALRNEKGLTQEQLAEKFHVSGRTVSRWETGSNMPDVSLLVEIADFYGVDVRELIDGERKNTGSDAESSDVAARIADYAGTEKSRLLRWVQVICFVGVLLITLAIILQCSRYEPDLRSSGSIAASFAALIAMSAATLYVNGILAKLLKKKGFVLAIRIAVVALGVLSVRFIIGMAIVLGIAAVDYYNPYEKVSGVDRYDKPGMIEQYRGDFDSGFMIFPDTLEAASEADFDSKVKTGLFDSDGYFILRASYDPENFEKELERLAGVQCEITFRGQTAINDIRYDETMYRYPAYIASDGYDYVYEYALIDAERETIIYVLLSYPDMNIISEYRDYLKKDTLAYQLSNSNVLENFTIYAHTFDGQAWIEYGD